MEYEKIENISFIWFQAIYKHFITFIYTVMEKKGMLPFRKMSLLLVNTRARTTFLVAIYTVMEYNGEK